MEGNMPDDRENTEPTELNVADALGADTAASSSDPADEIPIPIAMSPAEIDERAQAVQAVRGTSPDAASPDENTDESRLDA